MVRQKFKIYWCGFDLAGREERFKKLQKESESADFWDNPQHAQKVMKSLSRLRESIESWHKLQGRLNDSLELADLSDDSLFDELEAETKFIEGEVERREFRAMLSGEFDKGDAILAIHAGAGGTDSQDWAQMLQRMYLRWMEKQNYETEIIDTTAGEEAGVKSVTISVGGRYAYGYLRSEKGVHRLVRISPFDANSRRHTSFAMVEVLPQVDDDGDIQINPNDIKIDTFKAGGAGGQSVQKNDTAVRITHLPTGIVASCQNERSQAQNREMAIKVLRARLLEIKEREKAEKIDELRGEYTKAEWGSQIRSYVLHPYKMVKDHRTNHEVGNAEGVLDGDLDGLIGAYLRANVGRENSS
ncbi:MAG: peptide chain release factor 2 [Anaerolineales bacterium]|nr:peptide chain release factor 2 [Chloroflexota bacterium]MBL6981697.1 peptide chain release factor 2 [Anaerolineales bacterium]